MVSHVLHAWKSGGACAILAFRDVKGDESILVSPSVEIVTSCLGLPVSFSDQTIS